jgi:CheY-like chemotaxis protein
MSNAAKFTENGQITLRVSRMPEGGQEWVVFQVSDTGIGLSAEQISQVFGAFTQADEKIAVQYGGTGLGLAIIRELAQLMGGTISVTSELGKGSTFSLRLPAKIKRVVDEAGIDEPLREARAQESAPTDEELPLVLVIDDEENAREILSRHLIKGGYRVITATSGAEGLALARELQPVAITLDVLMPEMDGWHVLEDLMADPVLAGIPVIMCTIVDNQELGFALGATEYLTKPIDRNRLVQVLQNYCVGPHCRILLVEDDPVSREMMGRTLLKAGWSVIEAENGRVALACLAEQRPDVILLDLMMPEMDGFEFIAKVQQHEEWCAIPVVVVTAKHLDAEDHRRLNGYVTSIIEKREYRMDELMEAIRYQLGRVIKSRPDTE